jgi:hypothetical protein
VCLSRLCPMSSGTELSASTFSQSQFLWFFLLGLFEGQSLQQ